LSAFPLPVGEVVTSTCRGIERTVEVAEPVGDVVAERQRLNTRLTEAHDHRQHVPRREAEQKRAEEDVVEILEVLVSAI